jgi:predicted DNA-binding ribbon-helix-helix protein
MKGNRDSRPLLGPSLIVRRMIYLTGRRTNVCVEAPFWTALKEIAASKNMLLQDLVRAINKERRNANLPSAIRLFVLNWYREQVRCPSSRTAHR